MWKIINKIDKYFSPPNDGYQNAYIYHIYNLKKFYSPSTSFLREFSWFYSNIIHIHIEYQLSLSLEEFHY